MERFMVDCFSSGGNLLAKRYKNTSPYTSLEEAREIFGEDATIENASALLNAIEPEEWVVQKIYQMDGKREEFEKNYLSKIGAIITLTSDSFARHHSRLKKTRSNIVTYWGEQVLDSELSEFANEHPDIWEEWNEFFVNDGRDLFIDPQGKQVSPEQVIDLSDEEIVSAGYQRYAPVQAAHKVAEQLAVFSTSLLRDIERVHKGESTTFILEKEIDILSIP
jgi:hypothetical protein